MTNSNPPVVLVTGASRGIGAAIAKCYARRGAHVVLLARDVAKLEAVDDAIRAEGGTATLMPLDLSQPELIDPVGAVLHERFGKLDAFVANAAILGELTPVAHTVPDIWDKVIAVNLTANFRLLRTLDPLLRAAGKAEVMAVTSGVTRTSFPYWGAYSVSKAGMEMLFNTYAAEVRQTGIRVRIVDPGVVATDMRASAFPGEDPAMLATPEEVAEQLVA